MRISYLSTSFIPFRRAQSVHIMKMCQALVHNGNDVALFARSGPEAVDDDYGFYGVQPCFDIVKCFSPAGIGFLGRAVVFTGDMVRRVWAMPPPDFFYGRAINCLAAVAHLGVPMGFEAHYVAVRKLEDRLMRWTFQRPSFKLLVTISEALRAEYLRLYPCLKPSQVVACHDGADLPPEDLPMPKALGSPTDRLRVGYVGNLFPGKGIGLIMEMARRLPEVDFHLIGGEQQHIEHWRREFPTQSNLHFHGFVQPALCDAYRKNMDVLLSPYLRQVLELSSKVPRETSRWMSPLKVFEYMAAGKPILCSDLPVLGEVLRHEKNALLLPPEDVEAWVAGLRRLRDAPTLRHRLGHQALEDLRHSFTWRIRADKIVEAARMRIKM